jgi:hypothetical protein
VYPDLDWIISASTMAEVPAAPLLAGRRRSVLEDTDRPKRAAARAMKSPSDGDRQLEFRRRRPSAYTGGSTEWWLP